MNRRAWLLLWTLALVWGASYLLIKWGLQGGIEPVFLVFARLVLAAAVLAPLARRAGALAPLRGRLGRLFVLAAIQVAVPFALITYGEEHIASSLAGILVATSPIFTGIFLAIGVGTDARLSAWGGSGIAIGLVGVALLFGVDLAGSSNELLGGAMVALAGVGYAAGPLYLRRHFLDVPSVGMAAGSMAASALITAPVALFQMPTEVPTLKASLAVLALGAIGTGVAFLIFYTLIAGVGAARASLVAYLAPGFALAYGALLLDEPVTVGAIGGLLLILGGSWLVAAERPPWRRRTVPEPAPEPAPVTS